jgi:hypothetical protein
MSNSGSIMMINGYVAKRNRENSATMTAEQKQEYWQSQQDGLILGLPVVVVTLVVIYIFLKKLTK